MLVISVIIINSIFVTLTSATYNAITLIATVFMVIHVFSYYLNAAVYIINIILCHNMSYVTTIVTPLLYALVGFKNTEEH